MTVHHWLLVTLPADTLRPWLDPRPSQSSNVKFSLLCAAVCTGLVFSVFQRSTAGGTFRIRAPHGFFCLRCGVHLFSVFRNRAVCTRSFSLLFCALCAQAPSGKRICILLFAFTAKVMLLQHLPPLLYFCHCSAPSHISFCTPAKETCRRNPITRKNFLRPHRR